MGPEFEKGDGRLRPSLQQRLPGAEGPPEGCTTAPRHAACGGPLPSSAEGPCVIQLFYGTCTLHLHPPGEDEGRLTLYKGLTVAEAEHFLWQGELRLERSPQLLSRRVRRDTGEFVGWGLEGTLFSKDPATALREADGGGKLVICANAAELLQQHEALDLTDEVVLAAILVTFSAQSSSCSPNHVTPVSFTPK